MPGNIRAIIPRNISGQLFAGGNYISGPGQVPTDISIGFENINYSGPGNIISGPGIIPVPDISGRNLSGPGNIIRHSKHIIRKYGGHTCFLLLSW